MTILELSKNEKKTIQQKIFYLKIKQKLFCIYNYSQIQTQIQEYKELLRPSLLEKKEVVFEKSTTTTPAELENTSLLQNPQNNSSLEIDIIEYEEDNNNKYISVTEDEESEISKSQAEYMRKIEEADILRLIEEEQQIQKEYAMRMEEEEKQRREEYELNEYKKQIQELEEEYKSRELELEYENARIKEMQEWIQENDIPSSRYDKLSAATCPRMDYDMPVARLRPVDNNGQYAGALDANGAVKKNKWGN
jgi:hypothetical protein